MKKGIKLVRAKGKIKNATKVEVNGIKFDSKLDEFCYRKLTEANIKFHYNEITFDILDSFDTTLECYTVNKKTKLLQLDKSKLVRKISFTPDFIILDKDNKWLAIIEGKGFANETYPLRLKLFKHYLIRSKSGIKYFYQPSTQKQILQTIELINEYYK